MVQSVLGESVWVYREYQRSTCCVAIPPFTNTYTCFRGDGRTACLNVPRSKKNKKHLKFVPVCVAWYHPQPCFDEEQSKLHFWGDFCMILTFKIIIITICFKTRWVVSLYSRQSLKKSLDGVQEWWKYHEALSSTGVKSRRENSDSIIATNYVLGIGDEHSILPPLI